MKKLYDMVHTEKYTTKDGEEKKKFTNVGSVLQRDDGSMCCNFLGSWINFYEPRQNNQSPAVSNSNGGYAQHNAGQVDDFDQDIPFAPINDKLIA